MCLILVTTSVGRPCDALTTFMPAECLLQYLMLFSGSKAGKGLRNKVQFHDRPCNCLYVFYVHNHQDQFLLPRNGPSNVILDCVPIRQFLVMNLFENRTMHDWDRIALLHPYFVSP